MRVWVWVELLQTLSLSLLWMVWLSLHCSHGTVLDPELYQTAAKDWHNLHTEMVALNHFEEGCKVQMLDIRAFLGIF